MDLRSFTRAVTAQTYLRGHDPEDRQPHGDSVREQAGCARGSAPAEAARGVLESLFGAEWGVACSQTASQTRAASGSGGSVISLPLASDVVGH